MNTELEQAIKKATRSQQTIIYWYCPELNQKEPVAAGVFCDN